MPATTTTEYVTTPSTTPSYTYRAQTDAGTKKWHLGAVEGGEKCFCGTLLMTPGDMRKFALKVPADQRNYQVDTHIDCVDCAACRRNLEWGYANGAPRPAARTPRQRRAANQPLDTDVQYPAVPGAGVDDEHALARQLRTARPEHRATITADEADRLAEAAAGAAAELAAPPSRRRRRAAAPAAPAAEVTPAAETPAPARPRRRTKADRAHELAEQATARRAELAASSDAALAAIEAAVAEATGEPQLSRADRAAALVDSGLADSPADARAQLADMGE